MRQARRAKRAVNVSIPVELLEAARAADINLSATLEVGIERQLRSLRRDAWIKRNAEGIEAYNRDVEMHGTFSDKLRAF